VVPRRQHPQRRHPRPEIDASIVVGFPAAQAYLGLDGHPTTIHVGFR
jgi:hypothetical protein